MPLFSSLRSKKARRPSVASQASAATGTTAAGGAGAGVPNEHGALSAKGSRSSFASPPASTTASPRAPAVVRDAAAPGVAAAAAGLAEQAPTQQPQHSTPPLPQGTAAAAAAPAQPAAPRPSELFAGKGVQWDHVRLAGPAARQSPQQSSSQGGTQEDLQSFLKARRQWVPTFVTEEDSSQAKAVPSDLSNLTFSSADPTIGTGQGGARLMSLADLDASHQRKQKLLGDDGAALGGSLFDEPSTSAQGAARAQQQQQQAAAAAAAAAPAQPQGKQPKVSRGSSWRHRSASQKSKNSERGVAAAAATGAAAATPAAPARPSGLSGDVTAPAGDSQQQQPADHNSIVAQALAAQHAGGTKPGTTATTTITTTSAPQQPPPPTHPLAASDYGTTANNVGKPPASPVRKPVPSSAGVEPAAATQNGVHANGAATAAGLEPPTTTTAASSGLSTPATHEATLAPAPALEQTQPVHAAAPAQTA